MAVPRYVNWQTTSSSLSSVVMAGSASAMSHNVRLLQTDYQSAVLIGLGDVAHHAMAGVQARCESQLLRHRQTLILA